MTQRILIVEDEEDNILIIVDLLNFVFGGQELMIARDGQEAIQLAQKRDPDLILMDLTLPLVSGWEAARFLKRDERLRQIPILAVTANAMVGDRERALAAGCDDYFAKPIELEAFAQFVGRYFGPGSP